MGLLDYFRSAGADVTQRVASPQTYGYQQVHAPSPTTAPRVTTAQQIRTRVEAGITRIRRPPQRVATMRQPIQQTVTQRPTIQQRISTAPVLSKVYEAGAKFGTRIESSGQKFAEKRPEIARAIHKPFEKTTALITPSGQPFIERVTQAGTEKAKPISQFSMGIYERAKDVSETIRRGEPKLSAALERQAIIQQSPGLYGMSKVIGYPVRSTAGLIEMGGMVPGGLETIGKTPGVIPAALALGVYQSTVGLAQEAKKDPFQVTSDIATGALFFGAAGRVGRVPAKVPYRVGLGTPKDIIIKASDVYVPKPIKSPLDIPLRATTTKYLPEGGLHYPIGPQLGPGRGIALQPKATPMDFIRGRQLAKVEPGKFYEGQWKTPEAPKVTPPEYFMSELKKPTEYGGTADIYMKVSKAQEQALAKSIAAKYEVKLGTARFEGKSQQVIEPVRLRTPETPLSPSKTMPKISTEPEALRIGEAARYRQIIGGKKLSDYVRIEKKLYLDKIDITMKEAGPSRKLLTDFPESKIYDTTISTDPVKIQPPRKPIKVIEGVSEYTTKDIISDIAPIFKEKGIDISKIDVKVQPKTKFYTDLIMEHPNVWGIYTIGGYHTPGTNIARIKKTGYYTRDLSVTAHEIGHTIFKGGEGLGTVTSPIGEAIAMKTSAEILKDYTEKYNIDAKFDVAKQYGTMRKTSPEHYYGSKLIKIAPHKVKPGFKIDESVGITPVVAELISERGPSFSRTSPVTSAESLGLTLRKQPETLAKFGTELKRQPIEIIQKREVSVIDRDIGMIEKNKDIVRHDLLSLKVKEPRQVSLWDDYNPAWDQYKQDKTISYIHRPTPYRAKARDTTIFPVAPGKTVPSFSVKSIPFISAEQEDDTYVISAPIPSTGTVPDTYIQPIPETYPEPYTEPTPEPYPQPYPEPYSDSYDIIITPPAPPPPLIPEFKFTTPEPKKKRKKEYDLTPSKKKALHPWFPASLENVNLEEMSTGKMAVHIKSRPTTQKLFKGLIISGKGIQTKAQYESKLPTKFM